MLVGVGVSKVNGVSVGVGVAVAVLVSVGVGVAVGVAVGVCNTQIVPHPPGQVI